MMPAFTVRCLQRKIEALLLTFLGSAFLVSIAHAAQFPTKLGDLDGDDQITILDLVTVINHMQATPRLSNEMAVFADVNQDGTVNQLDVDMVVDAILGLAVLPDFPLARILESSPVHGAGEVAVTRETIIRFTQPLAASMLITPNEFYAEFAGNRLLSRIEFSSDRRTATLFYAYPLPGSARVRVTLNGNPFADFAGRPLDLDGDGRPGGVGIIEFDTLSQSPFPGTIVCGRVFASQLATNSQGSTNLSVNTPLAGVTVTADGLEQQVRAVTDQFGDFRITNAPAGRFFVHIDGRTLTNVAAGIRWPDLRYYPAVGKEWESIPGGETNIGEVFLPLVSAGTLQAVSPTNDTVITFPTNVVADHPELQGVSLTVPANALYSDNGSRGGMVGIAPVPSDRLPGPLPTGLSFPLVITVQTDGPGNFSQPVPVCFPNVQAAPPGSKAGLFSYDHDSGQWVVVGSMTVSADGRLICSDPGVGILAPGWHGACTDCSPCPPGQDCPPTPPPPDVDPCRNPDPCKEGCPPNQCCEPCDKKSNPVIPYSGEKVEHATDLRIKGVGMDFVWQRHYGSQVSLNSVQGNGWTFAWDQSVQPAGTGVRLRRGLSRSDLYRPAPGQTNSYCRLGFFDDLRRAPDGSYALTTGDQHSTRFLPFDGSPAAGKIASTSDRNGNTMSFFYDDQGRLNRVRDTLDRDIAIAYNSDGFIESVTDFAGRSVRYAYYGAFEPGGSFGDLKSVTTPSVVGTPNGDDFPNGKTTVYTYSKGFADDRLNHNLLTITDGRGSNYLQNIYSPVTDPRQQTFDYVVRQIRGGDIIDFTYVFFPNPQTIPLGQPNRKTIIRDREGNVTEHFYDAGNREILLREYTGRADLTRPTTDTDNRPTGKLRPQDPDYFETRYEYNADWKQTRIIHPNGNITENVYESDLQPSVSPRMRGNLRAVRHLPGTHQPVGDQTAITEDMEYDGAFGCGSCGFNFVTKRTDGRGNFEIMQYDSRGNLTNRIHSLSNITEQFEFNARGQMTRHVHPDNGSGHRRVDKMTYYEDGPQRGYVMEEIIDFGGLNLTTRYEYDLVGNVVRKTDPRGHDTQYIVNALDQVVREISPEVLDGSGIRYTRDYFFDANNNLVRTEIENRRALMAANVPPNVLAGFEPDGSIVSTNPTWTTTFDYEILNNPIRRSEEVESGRFIVTEFGYDRNRNRTLTRFGEATAARQTNNMVLTLYDERLLPFREIRAPGGTNQSTTQFDYDGNRNRVRVWHGLEEHPHLTTHLFDAFNQLVSSTDAMGNVTTNNYDANGNRMRTAVFGEMEDVPGSGSNVRLSETVFGYDAKNRLTNQAIAFFNATNQAPIGDGWATTETLYTDNSQVFAVINDNRHGRTNRFDTANRLQTVTDAKGNTITYGYDANNNVTNMLEVEKSDLGGPDERFTTTYTHDNLNRFIATIDNVGNVNRSAYDSRHNRSVTIDANTNVIHYTYDGLKRQLDTIRVMVDRVGVPPLKPTLTTRQTWDDSSRLATQIDDNGNATTYLYDALNRKFATIYADFTGQTNVLDVHGNAVRMTDANGNIVTCAYDDNDRLTRKDIVVGPGVSPDTTFEVFKYDGLSRPIDAEDNDSLVLRSYDSLSRVTREVQGLAGWSNAIVGSLYDGVGNLTRLEYPGGRIVVTTYDELERKKRISDLMATNTEVMIAEYWYVGPNRVTRRDYANGTRCEYSYDGITGVPNATNDFGVKRMTRTHHYRVASGTSIEDRTYSWDRAGNKTQNKDIRFGGPRRQRDYHYDSVFRLIQSTHGTPTGVIETLNYNLDGVGNRLSLVGGTNAGNYTMDATLPDPADRQMNQYTSTPFGTRQTDLNGNLVALDTNQLRLQEFRYDYRNHMSGFTSGTVGVNAIYRHDAFGRRVERHIVQGTSRTSRLVYVQWQEIEEQLSSLISHASYVHGRYIDEILTMQRFGKDSFYHEDSLFSLVAITDTDGTAIERYEYADFGGLAVYSPSGLLLSDGVIENEYFFTGRRHDSESGLYQYRTRFVESLVARFTTRDSIGVWSDRSALGNGFAFVGNNPASLLDPFGTLSTCPTIAISELMKEIFGEVVVDALVSGIAADCAADWCRICRQSKKCRPRDWWSAWSFCAERIGKKPNSAMIAPLAGLTTADAPNACADACHAVTKGQRFKEGCCCCE